MFSRVCVSGRLSEYSEFSSRGGLLFALKNKHFDFLYQGNKYKNRNILIQTNCLRQIVNGCYRL